MNSQAYVPSEEPRASLDPQQVSNSQTNALSAISILPPEEPAAPDPDEMTDDEILTEAHEHFQAVTTWESAFRDRARQEFEFVDGLQHWDAQMRDERKGRPCLTFDRIGPACDQVVNDARQSLPEPKLSPVGEGADKETAEALQGLIRNIQNDSIAKTVWATGYEHAVKVGRGWVRVLTDWEDDESDRQKIMLKRVSNPFCVYPDPAADEFDYSDMRRCLITEDLEESVYQEMYPHSVASGAVDFQSIGDQIRKNWFPKGSVRVAEYWRLTIERRKKYFLTDGQQKFEDEMTEQDHRSVRSFREVQTRHVKMYKINGVEVLERSDWLGKWIPVVPIIGREVLVEGKRTVRGMVRPAMDANLSYDYMRSKEAEAIGLAPVSQWLAAKSQIENYSAKWSESNRKAYDVLEYDPVYDQTGQPIPPPQRISPSVDISAIAGAIAHAADDIRATTATFRPDIGEPQGDQSGKAVLAIQKQGDNAHFNYHDNLATSQMHVLRIIVDLVPKIYDEERLITISDPDGSHRQVWFNKPFHEKGVQKIYDLKGAARYDVALGTGPSYAVQRDQDKDQLLQLTQAMPQVMARGADLLIKVLSSSPTMDELADRLRPPDVKSDQEGDQPQIPPQAQQQMAQMQQMIQALTAQLQAQAEDLRAQRIQNDSKERIAAGNNATQLAIADLKAGTDHSIELMQQQIAAITSKTEQLHQLQLQREQQEHERQIAETQAQPPAGAQPAAPGSAAPQV